MAGLEALATLLLVAELERTSGVWSAYAEYLSRADITLLVLINDEITVGSDCRLPLRVPSFARFAVVSMVWISIL